MVPGSFTLAEELDIGSVDVRNQRPTVGKEEAVTPCKVFLPLLLGSLLPYISGTVMRVIGWFKWPVCGLVKNNQD